MDFDAIIIGAGPGGYSTAIRLGQKGKKVMLVEKDRVGGECLNYGCIPSKALIELSHSVSHLRELPGVDMSLNLNMEEWQQWKWSMIQKLTGGVESLCKNYGVQLEKGEASIVDRNTVSVNGHNFTCENMVIATGSVPVRFDSMKDVLFNREILDVKEIPQDLVIIGGGYIGVELGTAFAKLGSHVTIVEMMEGILPGVDRELVRHVERRLRDLNVRVLTSTKVASVGKSDRFIVKIENGEDVNADSVLLTVGRKPNVNGFGLENLGLEMDHGFIRTDSRKRTSVEGVYAVGDVSGQPMLAHKAFYDADVAADNIAGGNSEVEYRAMPYVIYSDPEISYTGKLEGQFSSFPTGANGRSLGMNNRLGTYRLYYDEKGFVTGAGIVAPHSSELISEVSLAVEAGLMAMDIGLTIHPHPTISEGLKEAAEGAYGLPLHFKPRN